MLFVSAIPNEAGITTLQIREAGLTQPILSGDGFDTPLIGEVAGEQADAVYYSTHASLDNPAEKVANFVAGYEKAYGNKPENAFAALGYDMMNLIADAIERAGEADPAAIRDALAATEGFEAVTGTITYPEGQRKPAKSVTIIQVQDGQYSFAAEVTPGAGEEAAAPAEEGAASGEPIKIGAMYNVTGGMSSIDAPGLNGMKLAAEEINAAGGVLGRPIEIVAIDGKTDQTAVTNAVSEMIEVNQVVAIGGLNDSTFALAAGPIAQTAGIPFVTAGATLPTLPEQVGDNFFMVPFGDDTQAYAVADYAMDELKAKTAYMLVDQAYDFTTALASFFKERWEERGGEIVFPKVTVGGTHVAVMAAALAQGTTVIENAACEPEITDVADCLVKMGARISGAGTRQIVIEGVSSLSGARHSVLPDRIETGTYAMAVAMTGGDVLLQGARAELLQSALDVLVQVGATVTATNEGVRVARNGAGIAPVDVTTEPFPGFPTDLQAQLMALMTRARGTSHITETIFENRFMHVQELARLGARISLDGQTATIEGVERLKGAPVMATDLRASVSLVIAALAAEGETVVNRVYHLDRGFERLEEKLGQCGAAIERISG
ncbi:MAG: hypothetical protein DPW22_09900 [Alphaproteobacteria bacterium]|nr:hypothetical protein [Alphaproteobacteria bacterium]